MDDHGGLDIEKLSKSQIILLTLLVSFVTSIATGIVTVSLMDQAPPAIAQTVNRVVERTVEKVIPSVQTAAVAQEKTVVIRESDLIAAAIEQMRSSLVRLYSDEKEPVFLGMGVVYTKSGVIIADSAAFEAKEIMLEQSGGQRVLATVIRRDIESGVVYLQAATSTVDGKAPLWVAPSFAASIGLGQTVFTMSGKSATRVADGIVSGIEPNGDDVKLIDTDISEASISSGAPLVDVNGKVVGISTSVSRKASQTSFMPSTVFSIEPKAPVEKEVKK
jgi:S1-C subfamily serine protease